jgi:hypothetical protein
MIDAYRAAAAKADAPHIETRLPASLSVRLVDIGPQSLDLLGALSLMGCPAELAAAYVEASVRGDRPEVLIGAAPADANRVAEALRNAGATVSVEPAPEPSAEARQEREIFLSDGRPRSVSKRREVDTVELYLAAYNAGDVRRLVGCLSATAVLSDATGAVIVEGAEAIGRRMADIFGHYPDRAATVLGRLIAGPWVLDHHRTTFGGGATEETILCFRVVGGLIERLVLLTTT